MAQDPRLSSFNAERRGHWNRVATTHPEVSAFAGEYYRRLAQIYRFFIPPGLRVLEIGSGSGDLLAALEPADGTGVDFSEEMVRRASARHPTLKFVQADAHDLAAL